MLSTKVLASVRSVESEIVWMLVCRCKSEEMVEIVEVVEIHKLHINASSVLIAWTCVNGTNTVSSPAQLQTESCEVVRD